MAIDTDKEDDKKDNQKDSPQTSALIKKFSNRITLAKEQNKEFHKDINRFRQYQYGTIHNDGKSGLVRTNLIFSTMATLLPHIYAKNPDVSVSPTPIVEKDQYQATKMFGATCEILLDQKVVKEAELKSNAKANCRSSMVTSIGWIKMCWQENYESDPLMQNRIQDSQTELARLEMLIKKADDAQCSEYESAAEELRLAIAGMQKEKGIPLYKGFVIDRVRSEDLLILDDAVEEFHQYKNAKAISHIVWMTAEDFEMRFERKPSGKATKFEQRALEASELDKKKTTDGKRAEFYCVHEIWDKESKTVYTWLEGEDKWCDEPYQPTSQPHRWYPFYGLAFNIVEGRFRPLSDVELLMELQDEYNTTRTNYAEHRKKSLPIRLFRTNGSLTDEDVKNLQKAKSGDMIGIEGMPNVPLGSDIAEYQPIRIDPNVYDVSAIRNDMDLMSGLSDAARGNLLQPKTATEADIMSNNMNSRVDERRDVTEDWLTEIFVGGLETMLITLNENEVRAIAGQDATWPEMNREQIWSMVRLSVRGGSTTKPNKAKERETWTQLLPQIQTTMQTVMELRQNGEIQMANAAVELLRETLQRFDENIDLDMFIPSADGDDEMSSVIAQLQECKKKLQEYEAQLPELQKAADANNLKLQEAEAKGVLEKHKQDGETARHQATVASNERLAVAKTVIDLSLHAPGDEVSVLDQANAIAVEILKLADAVIGQVAQTAEQAA